MTLSEQSYASVLSAIKDAVSRYKGNTVNQEVTDIHLQPNQDSGELLIFNDDEEEFSRVRVNEWIDYGSDAFNKETELVLRKAIVELKEQGMFDDLSLLKPYSFVLVDDEKETIVELMLVDDEDTLLLDEELLKGLDEELDAFLKDLLEK